MRYRSVSGLRASPAWLTIRCNMLTLAQDADKKLTTIRNYDVYFLDTFRNTARVEKSDPHVISHLETSRPR